MAGSLSARERASQLVQIGVSVAGVLETQPLCQAGEILGPGGNGTRKL